MNVNERRSDQQRAKRARNNNNNSTSTTTTQSSRRLIIDQFCGSEQRSFPGQPPAERYGRTYNKPFSELNHMQRAAAREVLGIVHKHAWELAMPRRVKMFSSSTVLTFQTKIWDQLSSEHQDMAKTHLDMDEKFWNEILAPFHDDLWTIPGVTLSHKEFNTVLSIVQKMSRNPSLKLTDLATFFLSLERLLLPSQGVLLTDTLKASPCFESLRSGANKFHYFSHHMLVASFLSDPVRFVSMSYLQLLRFWDDDMSGCAWGNAAGQKRNNDRLTYSVALCELHKRRLDLRRCVGPILCGTLPARFHDDISAQNPRPHLPKHLAKSILDEMLGIGQETIDPCTVEWLIVCSVSLHDILVDKQN